MKLQLILENQEVELNQDVSIPLNKVYENTEHPTDIIVDYSKSINIPMSASNNIILANSYRLDRNILVNNDNINLGIYLDPTKKIPMKLLYNSQVILEGYAKFVSANKILKNSYYTLNLFGVIGDIFQKLKNIVLSENELNDDQLNEEDGGLKYILDDICDLNPRFLDSSYVKDCWDNELNRVYSPTPDNPTDIRPIDVIGFAPSYRGYYNDFDSNNIQTTTSESPAENNIIGLDEYLDEKWKAKYNTLNPSASEELVDEYISNLKSSDLVGDGFFDYQMEEYRSYYMKPYIYFNQLMRMFQNQLKKLSDYEIRLDESWFNANNPYWTRMCYMLDFLDSKDSNEISTLQATTKSDLTLSSSSKGDSFSFVNINTDMLVENEYLYGKTRIMINPFYADLKLGGVSSYSGSYSYIDLVYDTSTYFEISISVRNPTTNELLGKGLSYASFYPLESVSIPGANDDNYVQLGFPQVNHHIDESTGRPFIYNNIRIPVPEMQINLSSPAGEQIKIIQEIRVQNLNTPTLFTVYVYPNQPNLDWRIGTVYEGPSLTRNYISGSMNAVYINRERWRNSIPVNLRNIYYREDSPLFDIIVQYTKMFGLMWVPDYENHIIKIVSKQTYFKDYKFLDWSDRLVRERDFIVEPITFGSRYISFNYEDVEGFRYTGYKDKFGVNYGEKLLSTGYDFGYETKDLFSGIYPSSVSSKNYSTLNQWVSWDLSSFVPQYMDENARIDCENTDENSSISIYNWYLRGENTTITPVFITDDTPQQDYLEQYCWISPEIIGDFGIQTSSFPTFNIAIDSKNLFPNLSGRVLSCVFNTPSLDFTSSKLPTKSLGNSIYDLFWDKYINERYNIQNKKVTAYFHITPTDFIPFTFNKFIILDNQLFIINKIFDYDLNSNGLTKVELIQITDISAYTTPEITFPNVVVSTGLFLAKSYNDGLSGSATITNHVTVYNDSNVLVGGQWTQLSGSITYSNNPNVPVGSDISNYISLGTQTFDDSTCSDSTVLQWNGIQGCVFEGNVKYEIASNVYDIPIILDFTATTPIDPDEPDEPITPDPEVGTSVELSPSSVEVYTEESGLIVITATIYETPNPSVSGQWLLDGVFLDSSENTIDDYTSFIRLHNPSGSVSSGNEYIDLMWNDMNGCYFNGSISYTIDDITFTIPVIVDNR